MRETNKRQSIKFLLPFLSLFLLSSPAKAALPDPATWVLHAIGGYFVAKFIDENEVSKENEVTGIATASVIGIAKEIHDLNFSVPDAFSWSIGAWLYYRGKENHWCWDNSEFAQMYWYMEIENSCLKTRK